MRRLLLSCSLVLSIALVIGFSSCSVTNPNYDATVAAMEKDADMAKAAAEALEKDRSSLAAEVDGLSAEGADTSALTARVADLDALLGEAVARWDDAETQLAEYKASQAKSLAEGARPFLPPPFGSLLEWGLPAAIYLANKRTRKTLLKTPAKKLKEGDVGGAVQSLFAGIGLGHSEPDPRVAYRELQEKGLEEGWVDPTTGKTMEEIGRAAAAVSS